MKEINSILIEGDSWGCGAWASVNPTEEINKGKINTTYGLYHSGIERYFMDFYSTIGIMNLSDPGKALKNYFLKSFTEPSICIVYVTDPLRNLTEYELKYLKSYDRMQLYSQRALEFELSRWSIFNFPIYLLGGISKVTNKMVDKYPNMEVIIPSVLEFLLPEITHPPFWISSEWLQYVSDDIDSVSIKKIVDISEWQQTLEHGPDGQKYFYPDGAHPNHLGYLKVFNYIVNFLKGKGYHLPTDKDLI